MPSDHVTVVYSEQVSTNGNSIVSTANGWVPTAPGIYYWTASYSGDANNIPVTSGASDDPVTVRSGTVNVSTIIIGTNHIPVVSPYQLPRVGDAGDKHADATVLDTATVTGTQVGVAPTGTVTYTFTGTNGTSLAGLTVPAGWTVSADRLSWSETVTMSAGAVPDSSAVSALPPGSYGFVAQYSGDANYFGATSALEPLTIKWGTGAIIEPPHTTCAQVRYDLAHESTGRSNVTVRAHVSSGNIRHPVTPPFLKYFVRLIAPSSSFQIDVNQASPYPLPALAAVPGHVTLHNANARLIGLPRRAVTITPTDVKIKVNKLTPGSAYYIGIRYNTKKLVGVALAIRKRCHGPGHLQDDPFGGRDRAEFDGGAAAPRRRHALHAIRIDRRSGLAYRTRPCSRPSCNHSDAPCRHAGRGTRHTEPDSSACFKRSVGAGSSRRGDDDRTAQREPGQIGQAR